MCDICDIQYFFSEKQRIQLNKTLDITGVVEAAINQLYDDRKIDQPTRDELIKSHYEPLKQAVNEGVGVPPLSNRVGEGPGVRFEYGTPNYEFLKQLQTNTAVFAAFKAHSQIKEMAALLKDNDGNLRSKEDFKKEALKIDSKYRVDHLDTQYDTAVRSARMASQWAKFQKNKRIYPNLRYMLTKAAKPDANHMKYVGITRPVDDAFWNAHYPPNRWRCQCSVEQTDDAATDVPDNLPEVPAEFAFNSGKTGQVFDLKNSEYIKSVPPKEQPALIKKAKEIVNMDAAKDLPYQTLYKSKNGAEVTYHPLEKGEPDFNQLTKTAISLANKGYDVQMLPGVKDQNLRNILLPADIAANSKTPDYIIDKNFTAEMKDVQGTSRNSIKRPFSTSKGQSENIIINIPDGYPFSEEEVLHMVNNSWNLPEGESIKKVWVNYKGSWHFDLKK